MNEFIEAMSKALPSVPEAIVPDGEIHRFGTNGKNTDDAGWYVYSPADGSEQAHGAFGCWRTGSIETWFRGGNLSDLSPEESLKLKEKIEQAKKERAQSVLDQRNEAARRAVALWSAAQPADPNHPYLRAKMIAPHGIRQQEDTLLVPMTDESGDIRNLERITQTSKKGLYQGARKGLFHLLGESGAHAYICEGFATGATIFEATGKPTYITFTAGNLLDVARALHTKHPSTQFTICADDDHLTDGNPGRKAADDAAHAIGADVAVPGFGPARKPEDTDFNDLFVRQGADAVLRSLGETEEQWPPSRADLVPTHAEFTSASLAPRCIVENYIYADVAQIVGVGGAGKTTMILHESVNVALGREVWGMRTENPGWTLFVTKEDQRERLIARLREISRAMDLGAEDTATVLAGVVILDVTGTAWKLIFLRGGNIERTALTSRIVERYREDPPAMIVFDPVISFGASESMVNDNEDALIQAARHLVSELDCCVRFCHHTGKANARAASTDQYSGRGGTALADGSRMTAVLSAADPDDNDIPDGCTSGEGVGILKLERHKISYAKPNLPPIWIRREGFSYTHFIQPHRTPAERSSARTEQLERFLISRLAIGESHTARSIRTMTDELGMSQREIVKAVAMLEASGRVIDSPLPPEKCWGRRKTFLKPMDHPS